MRRTGFNPRVLAGGRDCIFDEINHDKLVSIHASSREDATTIICVDGAPTLFQSTRPRGRTRPRPAENSTATALFQSTRPRGRTRPGGRAVGGCPPAVSIHASSREDATEQFKFAFIILCFNPRVLAGGRDHEHHAHKVFVSVSIHASSREDATIAGSRHRSGVGFNPRVLAGGRDGGVFKDVMPLVVSIHASSREDATSVLRLLLLILRFNPRVLAGGRDNFDAIRYSSYLCFNPRVLAGGRDIGISAVRDILIVSIPVPSQSRALAISQSRNLAIMDCSLQAAGERKVKTMAKICQAETAIRGSLRVHDKRKPLNARRMPMHSFVSTPLQGTLDPME